MEFYARLNCEGVTQDSFRVLLQLSRNLKVIVKLSSLRIRGLHLNAIITIDFL